VLFLIWSKYETRHALQRKPLKEQLFANESIVPITQVTNFIRALSEAVQSYSRGCFGPTTGTTACRG
jgi:hypothetical protein